jgi:Flp pilus assembly protein TadD
MARSIEPRLTGAEKVLLTKHYTDDVQAYQLYLKGRYELRKRNQQGLTAGIKYFNDAIARDPQYALAFAGVADGYLLLSVGDYGVLAPKDAIGRAKDAATRALALDDSLAEAHTSLGFLSYAFDWDWANAETHFRRAIELNSNYATAHHWYALCLTLQGKTSEGLNEAHRALEIDPLSPIINTDLGLLSYYAHDYGTAIEQLKRTLTLEPDFAVAHWRLGLAYAQSGNLRDAENEIRRALELSDHSPVFLSALGYVLAAAGRHAEARQILNELHVLNRERYVFPNFFANVHLGLNDKEQALVWLQRAYEDRCSSMAGIKVEPMYDPLRSDSRFQDLMKHAGFGP